MAPMQKSATSARAMEPASPSMTLMTPVGFSTVRPPGRTMHHSRSAPGPPAAKRASWLFLSVKMEDMTVAMRILKTNGAWSLESPAPMLVTTETRLTLYFFMASMMHLVPSSSIVGPTSFVLPPSAIITPSTSPDSKTFSTSAAESTVPLNLNRLASSAGSSLPVEPSGVRSLAGSRQSARTAVPRARSWCVASRPVRPVAPKTATDIWVGARVGARRAAALARTSMQAFIMVRGY
mmetsp:Transcript_5102/g.15108  ORF Transcript_5102/g.15108 Transcript_5102/m.15108 type:complete len:236 (+) Transcript_5102:158-865(+)